MARRFWAASLLCAFLVSAPAVTRAETTPLKLTVFGDSLTAGYGLADLKDAFPAQLEAALRARGENVTVIAAGVSGDTTTDGVSRLDWSLADKPDAMIVELGGNDGLRGIDPHLTESNLKTIVVRLQQAGITVLLAGMLAPPNMGRDYADRFAAVFPEVAKSSGVLFYPFFLDGVAGVPALEQGDHIHPTAEGARVIVARILPSVEKLIAQAEAKHAAAAANAKP
jgi:acyl-CoA thioesterase-1